jgi:hypothetical protein
MVDKEKVCKITHKADRKLSRFEEATWGRVFAILFLIFDKISSFLKGEEISWFKAVKTTVWHAFLAGYLLFYFLLGAFIWVGLVVLPVLFAIDCWENGNYFFVILIAIWGIVWGNLTVRMFISTIIGWCKS